MTKSEATVADLKEIIALVDSNEYEAALKKHLWFYEASRETPGMAGVRLSYALESWVELGDKYAPAKDALVRVRNSNKKQLLDGKGTFDNFHDLSSINDYLNDSDDSHLVFLELQKSSPLLAKRCYSVAERTLVKKKDYAACAPYVINPEKRYEYIEKIDVVNEKHLKDTPDHAKADFLDYKEKSYTEDVCRLIQILVNLDQIEKAHSVQKRALLYKRNTEIEDAL
ncbi:MAG: hypothetical protein AAGJ55_03155 [Cyanobacteria bacterium J06555_12]